MNIFLSHSSKDKDAVLKLAKDLSKFGLDVWLDEWEIRVGDPITQRIQRGLEDSDYVAVWLTRDSVGSGWVEREWQSKYKEEVATGEIKILPLLGEVCTVPPLLADKRYANFSDDYVQGLEELLSVLLGPAQTFTRDNLFTRARDQFKVGHSSYSELVVNLTSLLRQHGTVGIATAIRMVEEYVNELPELVVNATAINPFSLPCGFHPCIHLTSALILIREGADDASLDERTRRTVLERLFACTEFWIVYLKKEPESLHAPQERLIMELLLCAAAVKQTLSHFNIPRFLEDVISGRLTLPTFHTDYKVTGHGFNGAGQRFRKVWPKTQQGGAMNLSSMAIYLFGYPDENEA